MIVQPPNNNHATLAIKAFHTRTGFMPRGAWLAWVDLYAEALAFKLTRRISHLEMILESTPTIGGWGQLRLVEAMRGEAKPDGPAPAAFLGVNVNATQPIEPPKKKEGLLARLRG